MTDKSQFSSIYDHPDIDLDWTVRDIPLTPSAVAVAGQENSLALLKRLVARDSQSLESLQCQVYDTAVVLIGHQSLLPWVDGAIYLGREMDCSLFLPTCYRPVLAPQLLERAIEARHPLLARPLAILPSVPCIVSIANSFEPQIEILLSFIEELS
ncbi:MAG: hypothetical protein K8F91_04185 [Candidatus Obscuribacterales bacterium]|nr:hypothetical protein [Candidatus Obscuribacterales bacterium]